MQIRETLLFELSRRLLEPPVPEKASFDRYADWRFDELSKQWRYFSNADITGKDVLDFGCGMGSLSLYLARFGPKRIVGVELEEACVAGCEELRQRSKEPNLDLVSFMLGGRGQLPVPDASFDTILAFDCVEHVMEPLTIFREWRRVLRPGGRVLIWWSPYRSPWGPHMEAVVPVPWAHVLFGERAMLGTAARVYDLPEFVPRPWHYDADGKRKPNVWRQWSSFAEQGYINQLDEAGFRRLVVDADLELARLDAHSFQSSTLKRAVGNALVRLPVVGEYLTSFYIAELRRP